MNKIIYKFEQPRLRKIGSFIKTHKVISGTIFLLLALFIFGSSLKSFLFFSGIIVLVLVVWSILLSVIEDKITYKKNKFEISDTIPRNIKIIDVSKQTGELQCSYCKEFINSSDDFIISEKSDQVICLKCLEQSS